MNTEILSACDHVLAAAVNGVYQGVLISVLVALGLPLAGRTNAATRHAVWFATLLLLACLIPAHIFRDYFVPAGSKPAERVNSTALGRIARFNHEPRIASSSPSFSSSESAVSAIQERGGGQTEPVETVLANPTFEILISEMLVGPEVSEDSSGNSGIANLTGPQESLQTELRPLISGGSAAHTTAASFLASKGASEESMRSRVQRLFRPTAWSFDANMPRLTSLVLLALWLGGAIVKVSLLLWRLHQINDLKATAVPAEDGLRALFQRLSQQLCVSRNVQLKVSSAHRCPILLGFVHPVVLLPATQLADGAETESILRHELAHVRRLDDWANLVQHVIQSVLFFHPAVWWISRQLSIQREIACDDFVLQQGCRPRAYALLLADLASRIKTQRPLLAPGVTTSKSQLQKRINMILNTRRNTSPRLAKTRLGFITSAAALLAALAIYSAPRLVLAQASAAAPSAKNVPSVNTVPMMPAAPAALPTPPRPPQAPVAVISAKNAPAVNGLPMAPVIVAAEPTPPGPPDAPAEEPLESNTPDAPVPPSIEPGPKDKSINSSDNVAQAVAVDPTAAVVVRRDERNAPYVVAVPQPPSAGNLPQRDSSLEQRLRRLEKMVDSLLEQKQPSKDPFFKKGFQQEMRMDMLKQHQEMADREAARAADQAKRAVREAEKSMKLQQNRDAKGKIQEDFARQIEALHKQREALEREVQNVERQIERLEQQQEKLQEDQRLRSELLDEQAVGEELMALPKEPCPELDDVAVLPRR